jgi:glycosyltransferase involved in cell wall biosynthesis
MITINITTFNRPELLNRCLEALTPQHPLVHQIIVVDDCSTSDYSSVIDAHQKSLNLIYHRHPVNKGNAGSRNTALKLSKTDYISFMDDDDYAKPEKYEGLEVLTEEGVDFAFTNVERITPTGNVVSNYNYESQEKLLDDILARNSIIFCPTVIVRRDLITRIGGFDENINKGVDSFFYRKLLTSTELNVKFLETANTVIDETVAVSMSRSKTRLRHIRSLQSEVKNVRHFHRYYKWNHYFFRIYKIMKSLLGILIGS